MLKFLQNALWFLVDNGPAFLTIIFASIALLRSQQQTITQDEMLVWILTVIGLLASSELIERLRRMKRIEDNIKESRVLIDRLLTNGDNSNKLGIKALFPSREFNQIIDYTKNSSEEIWLMGTTVYTTLNLIREPLISVLIRNNINFRVLLSQQDSPFLREKEDEEGIPGKNQSEVIATLAILKEILREINARGYKGNFEVRQYQRIAYYSLNFFDRKRILCSLYSFGRRSVELPMIEVESGSVANAGLLFRLYEEHFQRLWNDNRTTITLTNNSTSQANKGTGKTRRQSTKSS